MPIIRWQCFAVSLAARFSKHPPARIVFQPQTTRQASEPRQKYGLPVRESVAEGASNRGLHPKRKQSTLPSLYVYGEELYGYAICAFVPYARFNCGVRWTDTMCTNMTYERG
ncbi:hypothetical protein J6590_000385 [Homalodisca vitripennis]|nr:hypothetical protein J6590_000385 [Homalodisca vitripennis]